MTAPPPAGRNRLLPEPEALHILQGAGLSVIPHRLARTPEEAAMAARDLGCPVAAKVVAHALAHKSDVGGVILNLATPEEAATAFSTVRDRLAARVARLPFHGALIAKMAAPGGLEVILGMIRDPQFGPAVMFGLGGVFVEVYNDVVFRLPPLTEAEARTMLTEVKAARLLTGYRGFPPRDLESLAAGVCALARLAQENPEIQEIDLNPLIAYERGYVIVDAKILVRP
ncbi:MAG TPA: acetate--CoA ligase family protein [Candidatus Methylomirabilis sp.]|nr:acetate--CoA ligase family protein [Candidatus Methylomirabilis sp.]